MPGSDFKAQIQGAQRNPFSLLLQWETKGTEQTGCAEAAQSTALSKTAGLAGGRAGPDGLGAGALARAVNHAREREVRSRTRRADARIHLTASLEDGSLWIVTLLQGLGSYRIPTYQKMLTLAIHLTEAVSISRNCGAGEKRNSGIYRQARSDVRCSWGEDTPVAAHCLGPGDSMCFCPDFCLFYPRL